MKHAAAYRQSHLVSFPQEMSILDIKQNLESRQEEFSPKLPEGMVEIETTFQAEFYGTLDNGDLLIEIKATVTGAPQEVVDSMSMSPFDRLMELIQQFEE